MSAGADASYCWWKHGVVYQIYPRSFFSLIRGDDEGGKGVLGIDRPCATSGGGGRIGTLLGIRAKLDYIDALGVAAIWLSPVQPSPNADFGYDQSNYCDVDPTLGSKRDFKDLVTECHERGIRVILDGVFNHTSDQHAWFAESRRSKTSSKRDWYVWRKEIPNNWKANFGGGAWTRDSKFTGEYYLHSFLPTQPDLNWRNPEVVAAVLESMKYWLDIGVDGFRLDVFNCYFKDEKLRSNPRRWDPLGLAGAALFPFISQHHIHDRDQVGDMLRVLKQMRCLIDKKPGRMLVGETLDETFLYKNAAQYCGRDKLNLAFNFRLLHASWGATSFRKAILQWTRALGKGWPTWVVSNHDMRRHASRWGVRSRKTTDERMKLVALLLMTLRGTPFLYYGEELGMRDASVPKCKIVDPPGVRYWPFYKGRDGCRTPMQWDGSMYGGFSNGNPWMVLNKDAAVRNVKRQSEDNGSVLGTYRDVIALRKRHKVLQTGSMDIPEENEKSLLVFYRKSKQRVAIILNFGRRRSVDLRSHFRDTTTVSLLYSTAYGHHKKALLSLSNDSSSIELCKNEGVVILGDA